MHRDKYPATPPLFNALVARPVGRAERNANPDALKAVAKDEWVTFDQELHQWWIDGLEQDTSGCTAIVAFVTKTHIVFINAGDSRGILAMTDGSVKFGTKDHKPTDEPERNRIEAAGGVVMARTMWQCPEPPR